MPAYVETLNYILATGTIFLQIVCIFLFGILIFFRSRNNSVLLFFKKYTFVFGFIIALTSTLLSLFYSSVVGFPPCELCWVNRIFIYPQVLLFGMELYKRDRAIVDQSIALAILSIGTSIFHVYIENGGASSLACATGSATEVSCAVRYIYEFSYVSMPVMALTVSVFVLTLLLNYKYMTRG